jgi:hypothetical protein
VRWLRGFGAFLWDFVVGDDPWLAVAVVVGLMATGSLAQAGVAAWWVLPLVALGGLVWSVLREARKAGDAHGTG